MAEPPTGTGSATRGGRGGSLTLALVLGIGWVLAPGVLGPGMPGAVAAHAQVGGECRQDRPQLVAEPPAALARLGATSAWQTATGRGVVVAVVDSGVDVGNEHLAGGAVLSGVDLVGAEGDPRGWCDPAGHGTAVAGQIAARPVTGSGLVGLAPDAVVLPVRIYHGTDASSDQAGTSPTTARLAEGIRWAVDNGARIINVSISSTVDDPRLSEAVQVAVDRGALVVASAGNRTTTDDTEDSPRYPAAYEGVLGVAAVDGQDTVTAASIHGSHVDVVAPGTAVVTAFHAAGDCMLAGDTASTSYATAYVSAAAALVAERYPDETSAQWAHRLMVTAARTTSDRRDDLAGWGVIRPAAALAFVDDGAAPGPPSPLHPPREVPEPVTEPLPLGQTADELAPAQEVSAWWALGGVVAVAGALIASRLAPARHAPRR